MLAWRLGVDIGGTFTDVVLQASNGRLLTHKILSTPHDYGQAIAAAVHELVERYDIDPRASTEVVHGTTVCTNAILEGKGARVGLLTTRGFRDTLEIGRMRYPRLYDLTWTKPTPLVPRRRRLEVTERVDANGRIVTPIDESAVRTHLRHLASVGIDSLAVCFLHSYANPIHEQRVRDIVLELAPEMPLSLSCEIMPEIGEFERTSTTVINAYLQPVVAGYLSRLAHNLADVGIDAPIRVIQSNGGTMSAEAASQRPIHIVESGPAAGVIAAHNLAQACELTDVITLDMGGTTAKASIIEAGELRRASESEVGAGLNIGNRLNTGAGYRLRVPAIDIAEVGAGGGSLVTIDIAGALHVGPESAGAEPGPVCYGAGGDRATLTDANVLLGYLNPDALLGGQLPVDRALASSVFTRDVAVPLGLDVLEAAFGVHQIAVANMVRVVKAISSERGRDPRRFAFVAYGGNGPLHAVAAAAELGVRLVVVPPWPGLFSALGLLAAEPTQHASRSFLRLTRDMEAAALESAYAELERQVVRALRAEAVADGPSELELRRFVDVRYAGQSSELTLSMPSPVDEACVRSLDDRFGREHERTYGHRAADDPVEIVHVRIQGRRPGGQPPNAAQSDFEQHAPGKQPRVRQAFFGPSRGLLEVPVIERHDVGQEPWPGPLIVEEYDATTVVPPGCSIRRDGMDNLLVSVAVAQ